MFGAGVIIETPPAKKCLDAMLTREPLPCVNPLVGAESRRPTECPITVPTFMRSIASVDAKVDGEVGLCGETFATHMTLVWPLSRMGSFMIPETTAL